MKTCDQCGEEYAPGTGTTERTTSRVRLTERFCSESCAQAYDDEMAEDDDT